MLMFYKDEIDKMSPDQFVWRPYFLREFNGITRKAYKRASCDEL